MSTRRPRLPLLVAIGVLFLLPRDAAAQVRVSAGALAALTEHRVDVGAGVERSSGTVAGGKAAIEWGLTTLQLSLVSGELGALGGSAETRTMGEARVNASRPLRPWLTVHVGGITRRYSSPLAAQRWVIARTALEGRMTMLDGALEAGVMGTFDPLVSVSGTRAPSLSFGGATSLAYSSGRLGVRLARSLERANFPPREGRSRVEQLSALTLGVGWRLR